MVQTIWAESRRLLQVALSEKDFETWITPLHAVAWKPGEAGAPGELTIDAPNGFYRDFLRRDWQKALDNAVGQASGDLACVRINVNPALPAPVFTVAKGVEAEAPKRTKRFLPSGPPPRYTFDDFIVGSSNAMAHQATMSVVTDPGCGFNPLFIYGATGLGKTHLLSAAAYALSQRGDGPVALVPAEKFVNDMVTALKQHRMDRFREQYRKVRTLIVDDVQFFDGKTHSQQEFKQTFNALYDGRRQIILASDRPPQDLEIETSLRNRFASGCLVDVRPPDPQLRLKLVEFKSAANKLNLTADAVTYLADGFCENVRQLEGALNRVKAMCLLSKGPATLSLVQEALGPISPKAMLAPTIDRVMDLVSRECAIDRAELVSSRRTRPVSQARHLAMYLCRARTEVPLGRIGEAFGGRDHSTVLHGVRTVEERMTQDGDFRALVRKLETYLEGSSRPSSPATPRPLLRKAADRLAR